MFTYVSLLSVKFVKKNANFQSKLNKAFPHSVCFWQVQLGIKLGAKVFCLLPDATMVQEAGKQREVWQILYNAISGEGHRLLLVVHSWLT